MRFKDIQQATWARVKNPGYWVGIIGLSLFPGWIKAGTDFQTWTRLFLAQPELFKLLYVFAISLPIVFFSPAPWQWTGDDRYRAPWGRALLQVLAYAMVVGVIFSLSFLAIGGWKAGRKALKVVHKGSVGCLVLAMPLGFLVARFERASREARAAREQARLAQRMSARGSFSPRLLFGNLDHLANHAVQDPRAAEKGLERLASLYRQWLIEAEKPLVELGNEWDMAEQYLVLEKARWEGRIEIKTQFDMELEGERVPPLVLVGLLEQILGGSAQEGTATLEVHVQAQEGLQFRLIAEGLPEPSVQALDACRTQIRSAFEREGLVELCATAAGWELKVEMPSLIRASDGKTCLEPLPCF